MIEGECAELRYTVRYNLCPVVVTCGAGVIESVEIACEGGFDPEPMRMVRFGRWAALLLRRTPTEDTPARVLVRGRGLADVRVEEDRPLLRQARLHGAAGATRPRYRYSIVDLESDSLRLDARIGVTEAMSRAAGYFREFDVETNSSLNTDDGRGVRADRPDRVRDCGGESPEHSRVEAERRFRNALIENTGCIGRSVWDRVAARTRGCDPKGCNGTRPQLAYLSAVQLEILDAHYPAGSGEAVRQAYEWFATGDLFLRLLPDPQAGKWQDSEYVSNGGPNSANAFCFAEFALLAIEWGVDADRWLALLPALVGVQELFAHAFGEVRSGEIQRLPFVEYMPTSPRNINGPRPVPTEVRSRIARQYAGLGYEGLRRASGEIIRKALVPVGAHAIAPSRTAV
ncbi:MAG: hypothetical protein JNK58_11980 [Phycisphaerae bacterium]|nr:hypothetical protein [Phycisphaerae bacterium]